MGHEVSGMDQSMHVPILRGGPRKILRVEGLGYVLANLVIFSPAFRIRRRTTPVSHLIRFAIFRPAPYSVQYSP